MEGTLVQEVEHERGLLQCQWRLYFCAKGLLDRTKGVRLKFGEVRVSHNIC